MTATNDGQSGPGHTIQRTIQCEDCGQDYVTKRANTKYCDVCRLFRDLIYLGDRTKKCISCDQPFAPTNRNEVMCGKCDFIASQHHGEGECGLCHQAKYPLIRKNISVCLGCARAPAKRELFLRSMARKVNTRREESA